MFALILFLTSVSADWVEISQFHKETPLRFNHKPPLKIVKNDTPFQMAKNDLSIESTVPENLRRVVNKPPLMFSENKPPFRIRNEPSVYASAEEPPDEDFPLRKKSENYPNRDEFLEQAWIRKNTVKVEENENVSHKKPSVKAVENKPPLRKLQESPLKYVSREQPFRYNPTVTKANFDVTSDKNYMVSQDRVSSQDRQPYRSSGISKEEKIFSNTSLSFSWNKGSIKKVHKFGNVQRVYVDTPTVKKGEQVPDETLTYSEQEISQNYKHNRIEVNGGKSNKESTLKVDTENQHDAYKNTTPIEVLNLSDLENTSDRNVFPTIETSNDLNKAGKLKDINKHLMASVVPPERETQLYENIPKKVKNRNHTEIANEKVEKPRPASGKNDINKHLKNTVQNNGMDRESGTVNFKDIIHEIDGTVNVVQQPSKVENLKSNVTLINKTFIPIKLSTAPDPEEVMIKEILEAESSTKNADTENIERSSKLPDENRNTHITTKPKLVLKNSSTNTKSGMVKKITHPYSNLIVDQTTVHKGDFKQSENKVTVTDRSKEINIDDLVKGSKDKIKIYNTERDNVTLVDKELANIYMNENVEIIRQFQTTSTEEIPIRTTIKVKVITQNDKETEEIKLDEFAEAYNPMNAKDLSKSHLDDSKKFNPIKNTNEKESEQSHPATFSIDTQNKPTVNYSTNNSSKDTIHDERIDKIDEKIDDFKQNTDNIEQNEVNFNESLAEDTNTKTMKNLLTFLKVVTETISKNTKQTLKGKIRYLENLRDTIMANIEQRIDDLFPDDSDAGRRRSRSARRQAREHHVEFHSSEGPLMTLSFLTFAVFLIKLVLQVVHTYKNKAMMVPTVVATVGRALHKYHTDD